MLDLKAEYLYMKPDIDAAIARCLEHQQWILGPEVTEFEEAVARYIGVGHCVGTSSGTDALVVALRALAIKTKGQEYFDRSDLIITTPFTFTATGDAILRAGATPLFVDIDPITYNIDPYKIREAVKCQESGVKSESVLSYPSRLTPNASRVVGILPVHLYGQSCQMDEIMAIAREHDLFVVEDCAQAFGAKTRLANGEGLKAEGEEPRANAGWEMVGSVGDVGCFSFFPSKNLGGFGDAGAITTNDDELDGLIRMLIKHGGKDKYNVDHIGYNARLDTIQAAILLAKLKYIDDFNTRRRQIAQLYTDGLKDIEGIVLPLAICHSPLADCSHIFHQFTIRILGGKRDTLQSHLKNTEIDTMVYYPVPFHKMRLFFNKRCSESSELSEAEEAAKCVLSLPIEPLFDEKYISHTMKRTRAFFW